LSSSFEADIAGNEGPIPWNAVKLEGAMNNVLRKGHLDVLALVAVLKPH